MPYELIFYLIDVDCLWALKLRTKILSTYCLHILPQAYSRCSENGGNKLIRNVSILHSE
jgi:hypothetical protein